MARSSVEDLFRTRAADYGKAMVRKDKKEKTKIINDLTHDTGYNRKYVIHKLSKIVFTYTAKNFRGENITKARVRTASKAGSPGCHRGRPSGYRPLQEPLERIWEYFDRISPQRLIKLIKDNITEIAGYKYFRIDEHCKELLMSVSSATVSRLLRPAREKHKIRGVSTTTSPGDSLNKLIDVRVYYSFEDRERMTIIQTVENTRWRIVGVAFMDELLEPLRIFRMTLFAVMGISLLAAFLLSRIISRVITKPLRELEMNMRDVQNGNFHVSETEGKSKEVESLSHSFQVMVDRIEDLMEEVRKTEAVKRQRELDALQAKINPHFLYNTLDSVVWMAETGNNKGVVRMVTALASLFRISIAKGHDIITLKEELSHVESYLDIQSMRYKDRFRFTIDLPSELEGIKSRMKFDTYMWNRKRLSSELRQDFLDRASEEFREDAEAGRIDWSLFEPWAKAQLRLLMKDSRTFEEMRRELAKPGKLSTILFYAKIGGLPLVWRVLRSPKGRGE